MAKISKGITYFGEAVHPIFKSAACFYISFLNAGPMLDAARVGVRVWCGAMALMFLAIAFYFLLWGPEPEFKMIGSEQTL